jgi:outer membrane protein TolC
MKRSLALKRVVVAVLLASGISKLPAQQALVHAGDQTEALPGLRSPTMPAQNRLVVIRAHDSDRAVRPAPEVVSPGDATILSDQQTPIDLDSALRLAGVENPQIRISVTRVSEALAERQFAAAQILPTLNAGSNYDNHTGNLQQSSGNILAVNRSALYAGAGANAIAAGSVNIPGVVWNTNLSTALFNYLRSRQLVQERQFATVATRNEMLLRVAVGYLELLRAEESRAIMVGIRNDAREVARLTANYAESGQGRKADADRAATELRQRETDVLEIESNMLTSAARLAQLLNLDPSVRLHSSDRLIVPQAIVPAELPLPELIATAMMQRPELGERRAAIRRALLELSSTKLLPFSPNVIVGFSAGTFGGGSNLVTPTFGSFDARSDFDAVAYWSLQNLGVGNRALINAASARYSISNLEFVAVLNRVRSEVASAYARTQARYAQIAITEKAVLSGQDGFREDLIRIRAGGGLPIEVLNSLRLLSQARMAYLTAIIDYNQAEFELYVALGQPPAATLIRMPQEDRPGPDP